MILDELHSMSIRIDCQDDFDSTPIDKFIAETSPVKWFFGHEKGASTEKPHFQGIAWYKTALTKKQIVSLRNNLNYWCTKNIKKPEGNKKWQPVSFKLARKNTLLAYCNKEGLGFTTSLSAQEIDLIPKWKDKKELTKQKADILGIMMKDYIKSQKYITFEDYVIEYTINYHKVYAKYCSNRNMYYKSALTNEVISEKFFLELIGVFNYHNQHSNLLEEIKHLQDTNKELLKELKK